jgi:hypothetical protein
MFGATVAVVEGDSSFIDEAGDKLISWQVACAADLSQCAVDGPAGASKVTLLTLPTL